jgi:hypothetical protein
MSNLNILVVTRNRLSGVLDALSSVKRLSKILNCSAVNLQVTVQDNSDDTLPDCILRYFQKYFPIHYNKTSSILPMTKNWNEGLTHVIRQKTDYIAILADRRLVSVNLLFATSHMDKLHLPFICFDHQDVWINSHTIIRREHKYNVQVVERVNLLNAIGSAQINWHYPMLFNCVVSQAFMLEIFQRYGSFADGVSPDMNFLARIADMGIERYYVYDAPCIITNARHAATSNGSSGLLCGKIHSTEHTRLSGIEAYPRYMENFVTANITGSLSRYWSDAQLRRLIDASGFFTSSLLELSYPKSEEAFVDMKQAMLEYINDFRLDAEARLLLQRVKYTPACNQQYPIDSRPHLSNTPSLNLLSQVEQSI